MLSVCVVRACGDRQSEKVSVEPVGRHRRGATGRDQILIDTENTLSLTGAISLTQPCPFHTARQIGCESVLVCMCVCIRFLFFSQC